MRQEPDAAIVFARALLLGERDARPGTQAGQLALARWRAQPPFVDDRWWQARLLADGLTEPALLAALGESEAELAARLPVPEWAGWFAEVMQAPVVPGNVAGYGEAVFAPVAEPLLTWARACLLDRLRRQGGQQAFDPDRLTTQLHAPLPLAVHGILLRTLLLELHKARDQGELDGADARQRFASFVWALAFDARRRGSMFAAYPALARQLHAEVDGWLRASQMLASHLAADSAVIAQALAGGRRLADPVEVTTGLGDRHRGAAVARVRWADGTEVIYKPRSMGVDAHFQQLIAWLNGQGLDPPLRTVWCLDRGDHGWMEPVTAAACTDEAGLRRFYRRQGSLLALLYLLNATDFHAENLIAAGEDPVLIDLETVIQPGFPIEPVGLSAADMAAAEATRASVMAAGLLPRRIWTRLTGESADLSGLGFAPGQRFPLAVATVKDTGLDTMRIEIGHGQTSPAAHRPAADDAPLQLLDYVPDILAGFTQAYQICAGHRRELADGPLAAFAGDTVRVLVRPTLWYATVLSTGFHPGLLRDALDRERHFDVLWRDVPAQPQLAACVTHERADLWRNDIPYFSATVSSPVLHGSDGRPVDGLPLVPAADRVRVRLAEFGPADLARQRWLIRATVGTSAAGHLDTLPAGPPAATPSVSPACGGEGRERLIAAAQDIGERLAAIAFVTGDSAQWLGVNSPRGAAWSLGPLGPDLFHGLVGVALFLAWLGHLTADDAPAALARQALRTARQQLDQGHPPGFGGMAGIGGLSYALVELGRLWSDESLIDTAEYHALRAGKHVAADVLYDFTGGAAGTIAGLAALHAVRPSAALAAVIRANADHLLATAIQTATGIGWLPEQIRHTRGASFPIAGYAHGVSGMIVPLFQVAEITRDDRYHQAALQALAYEQALFDPDTVTWSSEPVGSPAEPAHNLAESVGGNPAEHVSSHASWCFGATGIGLSRLQAIRYTGQDAIAQHEISAALHAVTSQSAASHCLCHGHFGNLELLLNAAQALHQPRLHDQALRHGLAALHATGGSQWSCGLPLGVQTPGLMYGLAGIGYGMLRLTHPRHTPAVLTLTPAHDPPRQADPH